MPDVNRILYLRLFLVLGAGFPAGCNVTMPVGQAGGDGPDGGLAVADDALADFSLVDVNPNSMRYQETVSPRDYLGQISAWYFGHST